MVCVVGRMRDLILQLSKSSIYSTKPFEEVKFAINNDLQDLQDLQGMQAVSAPLKIVT